MTDTQHATEAEAWLDSLDPASTQVKDARYLREIAEIRQTIAEAEEQLRLTIHAARAAGDSWSAIGLALGTSRQAAFQRFSLEVEPFEALFERISSSIFTGHTGSLALANEILRRPEAEPSRRHKNDASTWAAIERLVSAGDAES